MGGQDGLVAAPRPGAEIADEFEQPQSLFGRYGSGEVLAREVRERWQAGDRDGAAGLVTDEMVLATTLIGTEAMVRQRLRVWRDAGVTTVRLYPAGDTLDARLATLARAIETVREISSTQPGHQD
jgi:alkanesulfonate monooxygenase SsuD/methylene tetrahydromethanopterin reductase-like flavin-dependent oxidoreductase (luciferase family)